MIKSNEGQTAVDEAAEKLRAYQLEEALSLVEVRVEALRDAHERWEDEMAKANDHGGPGNFRVEGAIEGRSAAIMELLAADTAYQRLVS